MADQPCQGCDNVDAREIFEISGFRLCQECRTYGTDKQISPDIQTRHEQQKETNPVARRQDPAMFGEFKLIFQHKPIHP